MASVKSCQNGGRQWQSSAKISRSQITTVTILCFVNLINYMDRFTIAGILTDIQCALEIGDAEAGMLQTSFIVSYMVFAPVFGYLGDRYSRKAIMAVGIFIWSLTTLLGSFMTSFWPFLAMRALVGIGEASYSTIAPTIISDLFVSDMRSKMLALFYFAIPVGSGLGYIVGSKAMELAKTAALSETWNWGLRVTPVFGALAVVLIMTAVQDPERGQSEGSHLVPTSWARDIKSLFKNRSFMLVTLASTGVAFVAGALSWWGPKFVELGLATDADHDEQYMKAIPLIFGATVMLAGLLGVPLGSFLSQWLRSRYRRADPLVCGVGMLISAPLFTAGLFLARWNTTACLAINFFAQLFLNLNWSIVSDIGMYVVIPTRRSTAAAFQILISHALGDAGSPSLIGLISDMLKRNESIVTADSVTLQSSLPGPVAQALHMADSGVGGGGQCGGASAKYDSAESDFSALQYAFITPVIVLVLGGVLFIASAWYIVQDKEDVDRAISEAASGAADQELATVTSDARLAGFDNPIMGQFRNEMLADPRREPL